MRTPENLEDAKAAYRAEKVKFTGALSVVAGSRWTAAILTAAAIAFGTTLLYAPSRLPHLSGVSFTTFGLPDNLDFGVAGEQAREAGEAAVNQGLPAEAAGFLITHASWIPWINGGAFTLAAALLLGNMWIMTMRRRVTRG